MADRTLIPVRGPVVTQLLVVQNIRIVLKLHGAIHQQSDKLVEGELEPVLLRNRFRMKFVPNPGDVSITTVDVFVLHESE